MLQSPKTDVQASNSPMQFIIVTGLSGAGKGLATSHFEDFGFFCADNMPPALIPMLAELCSRGGIGRVAVVTDVRGGTFFNDLSDALNQLRAQGIAYRILFLDADEDALVKRFNETRRRHPLSEQYPDLHEAIVQEREELTELREQADKIVNTSHVTPRELREEIRKTFVDESDISQMQIRVESFGFKHGVPVDVDLVFDIRFLPNPNYDRVIGHLDGHCEPVIDYVMRESVTQEYLKVLGDYVFFCVPQFEKEGKSYLTIAIGCTGGRHRSVQVRHRDLERSSKDKKH
jgi:UPF0042 nucleotide-binding protein